MSTDTPTVAVLGTGIMGAPVAANLARAGLPTRAWNRTRAKAEPLTRYGVTVTDTPRRAAEGTDVILTMLLDADAAEQAMTGPDGALAATGPDTVWVQCGTVGVAGCERLAALAAGHGTGYVDAPVLGTDAPAERGELIVLASGPEGLRERCGPVFDAIGKRTDWLGAAGAGSRLKMVVNSWVLALNTATAEAVALADGLGVDPRAFLAAIDGGPTDSPYAHLKAELMLAGDYPASFPVAGAVKDAGLILAAADRAGVRLELAGAVRRQLERAAELGHRGDDMAAVYEAARAG